MKEHILQILKNANGQCVSGEEIASSLNVSRTAIWKKIQELKTMGYEIKSVSRNGYTLKNIPDLLLPNEISECLNTTLIGKNIIYYEDIDSTNNQAKTLAFKGALDGTVVISEAQMKGKGRLSRGWFSPKYKGIWFSVILRPKFLPHEAPKCTLLAAVAITRAIRDIGINVGIKWPNDILYNGKKIIGTLTEMNTEMERINYVVIGTGINVNILPEEFPEDIKDIATSLSIIKGKKISRLSLFKSILEYMEDLYFTVNNEGFSSVLNEWRKYSITLGQEVNVIGVEETFHGKAIDIDNDGALLIETPTGISRVLAGDVSIRPYA